MDILSQLLKHNRLNAKVFLHSQFCGDWAVDTSGQHMATFHVIARGSGWLHMPDSDDPIPLRSGDLVVFPRDAEHIISNVANRPGKEVPLNQPATEDHPPGPSTSLICGYFEFENSHFTPLLNTLPEYLVIQHESATEISHLPSVIDVMIYETQYNKLGTDILVDRLSEMLFIYVLRAYIKQYAPNKGYIAAMFDSKLQKALEAFHSNPEDSWSIEGLAKKAGMSRAAFSNHFHHVVEQTPLQYMTNWRMQLAYELLSTTDLSMIMIAEKCGYQSEAAFSKVFKKQIGAPPSKVRPSSRQ